MDRVLEFVDSHISDRLSDLYYTYGGRLSWLTSVAGPGLQKQIASIFTNSNNVIRQGIELFLITWIMGTIMYLGTASFSYFTYFEREEAHRHPKFLKNQEWLEIKTALLNLPGMALLTFPWFLAEIHGYSQCYDRLDEYGYTYLICSVVMFLLFSDFAIYWIHRALHHRLLYAPLHKLHHKWVIPTPFSSHAFNFLDGYAQSLPYHIFPFLFPLNKYLYLFLFGFVNLWTVLIHDGEYLSNNAIVNGSAHHAVHHMYFNYNYGQFFTLFDRLGSSHRQPEAEMFDAKLRTNSTVIRKQISISDSIQKEVEGKDDRVYAHNGGEL
ncbi:C-5 sterol desaturase Erg32 [Schizosaccharomyces japonicus yFS275]|uniref:C-5 sterol desaturase Erg32 n=1 Tax=Schizosaccharomyces japonicus (strain yFS275 / FY16936) TaxID=402676 RepID=B6K4F3_SCHJY|nr:C-5 sterol desaturase Erg32 [Schizosaccharomyces japonicus yFS275]EEB08360.1 C-5 sterol desaturase Erg32 [Schizosaccharomyces japonicus yFS275]